MIKYTIIGKAVEFDSLPEDQFCPMYSTVPQAKYPSPVDGGIDQKLNLHRHLVRNESATYFLKAAGDSMIGAGIHDRDTLIVDCSVVADNGRIVIAAVDNELTVKRLVRRDGKVYLSSENPDFPEIDITNKEYFHVWGVVTNVIHNLH